MKIHVPEFSFGVPQLHVFDDVVSGEALNQLWSFSQGHAVWEFKNRGEPRDPLTSWVADIMNYFKDFDAKQAAVRWQELGSTMPFLHEIWDAIKGVVDEDYEIRRAFLNGHTFGLGDGVHDDGELQTFLLYVNPEWLPRWGGETMFYNEQKDDVVAAVLPKPGRVVTFDGRIPHAGRAPSRFFTGMRVTLAFQTHPVA